MPSSLEDAGYTADNASGSTQNVMLSDIYALDWRTVFNKSIHSFLANYAMYYFDIDQMIFSPADTDLMLALKNTAVCAGVDVAGAYLRQQFPQLTL
jgi:hypothetical protein